jgi:hypothetical protein
VFDLETNGTTETSATTNNISRQLAAALVRAADRLD